ncbi:MAG: 50S ribosomal protein L9 [Thermoguttaceae bacterium]|nr:50S ribosomal protein L9 [Thermoguttaceae bacterium]
MVETKSVKKRRHQHNRLPIGPQGGVQLLLVAEIDNLGKPGDVVEVKPGYARNYLVPQGLAVVASDHHKRMVEKHKAQLVEIHKAKLAGIRALAEQIGQLSITIEANANEEGHLYGSVGAPEVTVALHAANFGSIAEDMVRLQGPLKELGMYTVKVNFGHDIVSDLKVWVVQPTTAID